MRYATEEESQTLPRAILLPEVPPGPQEFQMDHARLRKTIAEGVFRGLFNFFIILPLVIAGAVIIISLMLSAF